MVRTFHSFSLPSYFLFFRSPSCSCYAPRAGGVRQGSSAASTKRFYVSPQRGGPFPAGQNRWLGRNFALARRARERRGRAAIDTPCGVLRGHMLLDEHGSDCTAPAFAVKRRARR